MAEIGIVGWRGMVGSALMARMNDQGDFARNHYRGNRFNFFSTSQKGQAGPDVGQGSSPLLDAFNLEVLGKNSIIVSCQGGDYTKEVYPHLRQIGWEGHWIDAASAKRMDDDSMIVLSPINGQQIDEKLEDGMKNLIGGNCTVSLLLMAMGKLLQEDLVEWVDVKSYQAYSGAGAAVMQRFVQQMNDLGQKLNDTDARPFGDWDPLRLNEEVHRILRSPEFTSEDGFPLAGNLTPWIDTAMDDGTRRTREEWKAEAEGNKILGREGNPIPIDGLCVRVGAACAHSQAVTVQLKDPNLSLEDVERLLGESSDWTKIIPHEPEATKTQLTPVAVAGTHNIHVGRVRPLHGPDSGRYTFFTVGDQLNWGAQEPVRLALNHVLDHPGLDL